MLDFDVLMLLLLIMDVCLKAIKINGLFKVIQGLVHDIIMGLDHYR